MKSMKKLITMICIICLILLQATGNCYAKEVNLELNVVFEGELPFYYEGEEKTNYKMLKSEDNIVYTFSSEKDIVPQYLNKEELYIDYQHEKLCEFGYPNKSNEELGTHSDIESYIATQEAIYYALENKSLYLYKWENEQGKRIVDAVEKIIRDITQFDVYFIELTDIWKDYELDSNYHYKEYRIRLREQLKEVNLELDNAYDSKIVGESGEVISKVKSNEKIKVIVPKKVDQSFDLDAKFMVKQMEMYSLKNSNDLQKQYIKVKPCEKQRVYKLGIENQSYIPITINNYNSDTNLPIEGNKFKILDENKNELNELITNKSGIIQTQLRRGKYYLKQTETLEGELQKELMQINVNGKEKLIELNIYNSKTKQEDIITTEKEINVSSENKVITENHTKDILNTHITNIQKEIINRTNETNLNNVNHFINNINKKSILNLKRENTYENVIDEELIQSKILEGENKKLKMSRSDYINYIDLIKTSTLDVPNLPIASR